MSVEIYVFRGSRRVCVPYQHLVLDYSLQVFGQRDSTCAINMHERKICHRRSRMRLVVQNAWRALLYRTIVHTYKLHPLTLPHYSSRLGEGELGHDDL